MRNERNERHAFRNARYGQRTRSERETARTERKTERSACRATARSPRHRDRRPSDNEGYRALVEMPPAVAATGHSGEGAVTDAGNPIRGAAEAQDRKSLRAGGAGAEEAVAPRAADHVVWCLRNYPTRCPPRRRPRAWVAPLHVVPRGSSLGPPGCDPAPCPPELALPAISPQCVVSYTQSASQDKGRSGSRRSHR